MQRCSNKAEAAERQKIRGSAQGVVGTRKCLRLPWLGSLAFAASTEYLVKVIIMIVPREQAREDNMMPVSIPLVTDKYPSGAQSVRSMRSESYGDAEVASDRRSLTEPP